MKFVKYQLPQKYKQTAMFIYKSKQRFHRFYDHNQPNTESESHSCVNQSFQAVWDYIKLIVTLNKN